MTATPWHADASRGVAVVAQHRMPEFDRERGSLRVLELVEHLLADGWSVVFLTLDDPSASRYVDHLARLGVRTLVGNTDETWHRLRELDPSIVIVAFWHVAETLVPAVRNHLPAARVLVDSVDLHFVRSARHRAGSVGADAEWLDEAAADLYRRELNAYEAADGVLCVSQAETDLLRSIGGGALAVWTVPLSERTLRATTGFDDRRGIVFVGNYRHLPNIEAVEYLCVEVLPRLAPELAAAHPLLIVGNELDERVRAAARFPGARLVGWVPEIEPYLATARVAVAPLLHGAGVKGKVLQAAMAGVPMVATPVAVEGIAVRDGEHVLIGSTPAQFARHLTTVLTDRVRWQGLADRAHDDVGVAHATSAARDALRVAVVAVLSGPPRVAGGSERRWAKRVDDIRRDVRSIVASEVRAGASVLVLSGGDDELLPDAVASAHFPADADGVHASHPVDGASAVTMLDACAHRGATHLVVPSTAYWWFHHYPEFAAHLDDRWHLVAELDDARLYAAPRGAVADVLVVAEAASSHRHRVRVVGDLVDVDLDGVERVVYAPGRRLSAGWLDALLSEQSKLRLDVAQAAAEIGSGAVPPAAVRQRGVVARLTRTLTFGLPVVVARRAFDLLSRVVARQTDRHDQQDEHDSGIEFEGRGLRVGILDACPVAEAAIARPGATVSLTGADGPSRAPWTTLDLATCSGRWDALRQQAGEPTISVVVATRDRADLLERCLASLAAQTLPTEEWELVLVDDGSVDATPEVVRRWVDRLPMRWARISASGRSAAKNHGVLIATGEIVLLLDDDDICDAELLAHHVKAHADEPDVSVAVLGYTDFAHDVSVSPLMEFVTRGATMLFAYHELQDGDRVGWRYFWEGRLSCKRALLVEHGLHDQRLDYTVDVELGYRLGRGPGLEVVHHRAAVSHMARAFTYDEFLARTTAKGHAQGRFARLHPEPEVLEYCHVPTAEQEWAAAAPTFDADRARIAELEPIVGERPDLLPELHRLYVLTLRGANRRAVLESYSRPDEDAVVAVVEPSPVVPVPLLSVVIPVWSVTEQLAEMAQRTVERLREVAQVPTEIVVIDNGSPHKLALRADVLIENETNEGVSPAWNRGIEASRAPTIVVLNSDVVVEPGWDVALHAAANDGDRIAFPFTDHGDGLGPRRPDQAGTSGWCFALTRRLFEELGPFDEAFRPAFFEDADYWTRAHAAGVELSPVPAARVRHARRTTARHHPDMDGLFQAHRVKYSSKHGIDPSAPPPYWHRPVSDYLGEAGGA